MTIQTHTTVTCDRCGTAYDQAQWKGVGLALGVLGDVADLCLPCIQGTQPGQPSIGWKNDPSTIIATALPSVP